MPPAEMARRRKSIQGASPGTAAKFRADLVEKARPIPGPCDERLQAVRPQHPAGRQNRLNGSRSTVGELHEAAQAPVRQWTAEGGGDTASVGDVDE